MQWGLAIRDHRQYALGCGQRQRGVVQDRLEEIPAPWALARFGANGGLVVTWGPNVLFRFDADGMVTWNLAMVALNEAGVTCGGVARALWCRASM